MANNIMNNKDVPPIIEINDLDNLESLLRKEKLADEQYVHWVNGQQEAYLRIQELNGKRTACHYDIQGRSAIPTMKERIENVLGVKLIDLSKLERANELYNPEGFAANQPIIHGVENQREHALSVLQKIELAQLNAMAAKAGVSKTATEFAKGGKGLFGFFNKKPSAVHGADQAPEVPPQKKTFGGS